MPTVTVLMPVYNAARYIREAIESILTQSYQDIDFLIIDDGSTDETSDLIQCYTDPRIRLIKHEQNRGLKYSLNEGITLSSHEFIARMDADDISHPWRLEKQTAYLKGNPLCAMVDSWVKIMDKDGKFVKSEGIYSRHVYYNLNFECCIYHSAIMFRKSKVQSIGGYQLEYAEDYDLFLRLSRVYKIHTLEEPLIWYRIHDSNLNTVVKKKEYEEFSLRVLNRNFQFYLGTAFKLPVEFLACYRYDMGPIIEKKDLSILEQCITLLDELSEKILITENPNRRAKDLRYMWKFKKELILKEMGRQLPLKKMIKLLLFYKRPSMVLSLFLNRIKKSYASVSPNAS